MLHEVLAILDAGELLNYGCFIHMAQRVQYYVSFLPNGQTDYLFSALIHIQIT